jgi:hypothetical protein
MLPYVAAAWRQKLAAAGRIQLKLILSMTLTFNVCHSVVNYAQQFSSKIASSYKLFGHLSSCNKGATTLSITTLSIATFSIMTLSLTFK